MKQFISHVKHAAAHPLAKGSMVVFAGTMAANVGAYAYHLVVGRLLGPEAYGELAALLSLSYILNVFAGMLQTVVTRFVAQQSARNEFDAIKALVVKLIGILTVLGVFCIASLTVVAPLIASYLHAKDTIVVYILFIGVVVSMIGIVLGSVLQGLQMFTAGMILTNINSILRLASGVFAAALGVTATLAAGLGAAIITTILSVLPIRKIFFLKASAIPMPLAPLFRTSVATFLTILGVSMLNSQDVVMVKHYFPELASGWYGALSTMGKIIFFASSSIMYVLLPIVAQRSAVGKQSQKIIYFSIAIVSMISAVITIGFFVMPEFALRLLYGNAFIAAGPYLGLFGIFSSLYTVAYTIVTALLGIGKSSVWILLILAALAQNLVISFLHTSITSVIWMNIMLSAALVVSLLVYYQHEQKI